MKLKKGCYRLNNSNDFSFSKNESVINILPLKIAIEGHIARVIGALSSTKWALDMSLCRQKH